LQPGEPGIGQNKPITTIAGQHGLCACSSIDLINIRV